MTAPFARTLDEAYLYVGRLPCPNCGHPDVGPLDGSTWHELDGERAVTLVYRCPECGERREFTFRVPDVLPRRGDGRLVFGGDRASELLDPGEWLDLAYTIVDGVPDDLATLDGSRLAELRREVEVARAAIEETLKFIPPGRATVPPVMFWSKRGHLLSLRHPQRFEREHLTGNLADCVRLLADLDVAAARREG